MTDNAHPEINRYGMFELICGFWGALAIHAGVELALADHLASGPKTVPELARLCDADESSLYRLLRALVSIGVFDEAEPDRFRLNELGAALRSDVPGSLAAWIQMSLGDHYRAWGELGHSIKTGGSAFDKAVGMPIWQFYADKPALNKTLGQAMTSMTEMIIPAVIDKYDFTPYSTIVDVGGGMGRFLSTILLQQPSSTGILFDRPEVINDAQEDLAKNGLAQRTQLIAGDFFVEVPRGGDLYLMKWILHDWDDDKSLEILNNCRQAMSEKATLLIVETAIQPGSEADPGKIIDLVMLMLNGGKERTTDQFEKLLAAAGFQLANVIPTRSFNSILEAKPIIH